MTGLLGNLHFGQDSVFELTSVPQSLYFMSAIVLYLLSVNDELDLSLIQTPTFVQVALPPNTRENFGVKIIYHKTNQPYVGTGEFSVEDRGAFERTRVRRFLRK